MKRFAGDVVGRLRAEPARRDVAGAPMRGVPVDVASFRHAATPTLDDPMDTHGSDAEWLIDFADFMSGEEALLSGALPPPDPVFRDQLRRRLWRTHLLTAAWDPSETH